MNIAFHSEFNLILAGILGLVLSGLILFWTSQQLKTSFLASPITKRFLIVLLSIGLGLVIIQLLGTEFNWRANSFQNLS